MLNRVFLLLLVAVFFLSTCPIGSAQEHNRKPAVYFYDFYTAKHNGAVVQELIDAGFEVGKNTSVDFPKGRWQLGWDKLKQFNVLVLIGMPGDKFTTDHAALLDKFGDHGGGIVFLPHGGQDNPWKPSRWYFEKRLGMKVFIEQVKFPERTVKYQGLGNKLSLNIAWTDTIAKSSVTRGVKTLWYPTDRASAYYATAPLWLSDKWTPLVRTGAGAHTITKANGDYIHANSPEVDGFSNFPGRKGDFVLAAIRDYRKGRVVAISVHPTHTLWSGYIPMFRGVLMKAGTEGKSSDWSRLFINLYRHLAEPSIKNGSLGGYVTSRQEVFTQPPGDAEIQWRDDLKFPEPPRKMLVGIAGARSTLSRGKNTVRQWCNAARKAGYDFLIFHDDMKKMNSDKWLQLQAECKQNSDENFLAYPGIEFEAEIGDRGVYLDGLGWWPDKKIFTRDGRIRSTRMAGDHCGKMILNFRSFMKSRGKISTWYGRQLAMGHFGHKTNPTPYWNHNLYQIQSVFTRENGKVLDDWAIKPYLEVNQQKLHIAPYALELMDSVDELPKPLDGKAGCLVFGGTIDKLPGKLARLGEYGYNGPVSAISVSTGPIIKQWTAGGSLAYDIPRWLTGAREKDFYLGQHYRMKLRLAVEAEAGIREIVIYDGLKTWRRYLPKGKKSFMLTLDVANDDHRHFVPVVTDMNDRKALGGEIQTENWINRIYWCSDRCNFGSRPYVHSAGELNPVYTTDVGDNRVVLNRWTFPVWGPDCGLVQGNVKTLLEKGAYPDNGWVSYFHTEPLRWFKIVTREYNWYQYHGKPFIPSENVAIQGWDQIFTWPKPPSGNKPNYPYIETEQEIVFKKEVVFDGHEQWSIKPIINWGGVLDTTKPNEYEIRLANGKRLAGVIPKGKHLELKGPWPSGSVASLRLHGVGDVYNRALPGTAIVHGKNLRYRLAFDPNTGRIRFQVGWQENGLKVTPGTTRKASKFAVCKTSPASERLLQYHRLADEFDDPGAGFSSSQLDKLFASKWYKVTRGKTVKPLLPLGIEADDFGAGLEVPDFPFPINSCPIIVSGLNTNWTAYYCEPDTKDKRRPVAVAPEGTARVHFDRRKKDVKIWVGHPVVCDKKDIPFDLIDAGDGRFIIEANNPGDKSVTVTFRRGGECPFLSFEPIKTRIPAGGRVRLVTETRFVHQGK